MTAWSRDMSAAPHEKPILVRHDGWECPCVMMFSKEFDPAGDWLFCDQLISDVEGGLASTENCAWTEIPT